MLRSTGFQLRATCTVEVVNEWPDVETAVRSLAAAGPSLPAIESVGCDAFCDAVRDVVAPLHDPHVGVRISSDLGWMTRAASLSRPRRRAPHRIVGTRAGRRGAARPASLGGLTGAAGSGILRTMFGIPYTVQAFR